MVGGWNKDLLLENKVAEACAKLFSKVIPKAKALEDKSRSAKHSPVGDDLKRALKLTWVRVQSKPTGRVAFWLRVPSLMGKA